MTGFLLATDKDYAIFSCRYNIRVTYKGGKSDTTKLMGNIYSINPVIGWQLSNNDGLADAQRYAIPITPFWWDINAERAYYQDGYSTKESGPDSSLYSFVYCGLVHRNLVVMDGSTFGPIPLKQWFDSLSLVNREDIKELNSVYKKQMKVVADFFEKIS